MEPTPVEPDIVITAAELRSLREAAAKAALPAAAPATGVELVEKSETGFFKNEPIVAAEGFKSVLIAVFGVLMVFNIADLTNEQTGVILGLYAALTGWLVTLTRSKVTPTSQVALTKSDARIIEATIAKQS